MTEKTHEVVTVLRGKAVARSKPMTSDDARRSARLWSIPDALKAFTFYVQPVGAELPAHLTAGT